MRNNLSLSMIKFLKILYKINSLSLKICLNNMLVINNMVVEKTASQ